MNKETVEKYTISIHSLVYYKMQKYGVFGVSKDLVLSPLSMALVLNTHPTNTIVYDTLRVDITGYWLFLFFGYDYRTIIKPDFSRTQEKIIKDSIRGIFYE